MRYFVVKDNDTITHTFAKDTSPQDITVWVDTKGTTYEVTEDEYNEATTQLLDSPDQEVVSTRVSPVADELEKASEGVSEQPLELDRSDSPQYEELAES